MPTRSIVDRLASGDVLLMDGATGSEVQRRGVNVSKGSTKDQPGVWAATANWDAPDVVRGVHEDYLRLGAEIIISNSFWTIPSRLAKIGLESRWEEGARSAAKLAIQARDSVNPDAYVAGGMAPPGVGDLHKEFADLSRVLADAGVDFLLPEWIGSIDDCVNAVDACSSVGLPVMLGVRNLTIGGTMEFGDSFADLAIALEGHHLDGILLMCSQPEATSVCLPVVRHSFDLPVGVYANVGYGPNPKYGPPDEQWHSIDSETYPPDRYAGFAAEWLDLEAQIIGGCCATTPAHIAAVREVLETQGPSAT